MSRFALRLPTDQALTDCCPRGLSDASLQMRPILGAFVEGHCMSTCRIRIINERPIAVTAGYLSFEGHDGEEGLRILISINKWEQLQAEAAHYCDGDDRRDHALGMIEATAAEMQPGRSSDGLRYIMLD